MIRFRRILLSLLLPGLLSSVPLLAQNPDRSAPPKAGPPPAFTMPAIQRFVLSNGLAVIIVEKHQVPLVQINVVVHAGAICDPPGKTGLAAMTAAMMMEGAGTRDALGLADAIDFLGARINASAGLHTAAVTLETPLAQLDSALALQGEIVRRPVLAQGELDRKRKARLTTLLQWRDDPRSLASVAFNSALYGGRHPYGALSIGDEKALRGMQVEDLRSFHDRYYRPGNAFLVVAGDVTQEFIRPKLEATFGGWKGSAQKPATPPVPPQADKRSVILVDKPGAAQTEIRIGRIGAARVTDDYTALVVMNTILGGSFSSRLNQNLRERHGYTYGAGSSFAFRPLPGPFLAGSSVHTAITDSALLEFFNELNAIRRPVPPEELERAKNYVALGFPADFQTVGGIAERLEELVLYSLPDDYFSTYINRILAVTQADVERVAQKYIRPETMTVVLVGDANAIQNSVSALTLGPLTVQSVEDVLGKAPVIEEGK